MYKIIGADQKEYGPVTAEQLRQWITEGRADGRTLVQAEGGAWKPLSTFPEFADTRPAQPSAAPPRPAGQAPPSFGPIIPTPSADPDAARRAVQAPAICLMVVGALGGVLQLLKLISHLLGWTFAQPQSTGNPQMDRFIELFSGGVGTVFVLIPLSMSLFVIFGAVRMMSLRNFGLSIAAAIIAILPCVFPCCCLGLPIGIWVLVVLNRPEVKTAFDTVVR